MRPARHGRVRDRRASSSRSCARRRRRSTSSARSAAMLDGGDRACAMEVSSHALELRRADGIHFAAAVFTNLTQDHLDFHPTMEAYFQAKRRLFARRSTRARDRRTSTTPTGAGSPTSSPDARHVRRSTRDADYRARDVRSSFAGSRFTRAHARTASSTCALAAARALQRARTRSARWPPRARWASTLDDDRRRAAGAGRVPGRFEPVDEGQAVRRARRLRAHAGLARERAARRARARRRPRASPCSAPAGTATAASAR